MPNFEKQEEQAFYDPYPWKDRRGHLVNDVLLQF